MDGYENIGNWERGYGRWNNSTAYRSIASQLVYLVHEFGSGRYKSRWRFLVFTPEAQLTRYQGKQTAENISRGLVPLFELSGTGGFDTGKSFSSKGGFRPSSSIPYTDETGNSLDGDSVWDGDNLLRTELGITDLTPAAILTAVRSREAIIRQEQERLELEEQQRQAEWLKEYQETQRRYAEERKTKLHLYEAEFSEPPELPPGYSGQITTEGFKVLRDENDRFPRYFQTQAALSAWILEEATRKARAEEAARLSRMAQEGESRTRETRRAAAHAAMPKILGKLNSLR